MMNGKQRRSFVKEHRTCVFGYERKNGPPSMSIVYYTMDGDDILISTMVGRAKAKAVERTGRVSLCVLDEQWPPTYLVVYGKAKIESELEQTVRVMMKIGEIMAGKQLPEAARPLVEQAAKKEERVVVRISPEETFCSPPVHLHRAEDAADSSTKLEHGYGARLTWHAD